MTEIDRVRRVLEARRPVEALGAGTLPAAVAVIFHETSDGGGIEVLFIKRAERAGDPWSGQVAFPGGRREVGDADLLATAMRETGEEVGVDLRGAGAALLGVLDDLAPRTPVLPPVVVRPFVFAVAERPPLAPNSEVQRAFWVPLTRLAEPGVYHAVTLSVRGVQRTFPAYHVGDDVIWGMTERILTGLVELLGSEKQRLY